MEIRMFESNYTCHFFRLWGYQEGKTGVPLRDALLGNMQNDFDAKFGDVCGAVGTRFFIIEFKASRQGFQDEISPSGKIHRGYLYDHLRTDAFCRSIARQGHFGAYAETNHQLFFEPYAHCVADIKSKAEIIEERLDGLAEPWHELNYQSWVLDVSDFYMSVTERNSDLSESHPGFFAVGLGITKSHLESYIQCMYEHLESFEDDFGQSILGAFSPQTGKFVAFNGSIDELVNRLHAFFEEMKASQNYDPSSESQSFSP
jgi:hypothetical protein